MTWLTFSAIAILIGALGWKFCDDIAMWLHGGYLMPECIGCQRHHLIPGCPVHDEQARRTPPAENGEAVHPTKEKGTSSLGY